MLTATLVPRSDDAQNLETVRLHRKSRAVREELAAVRGHVLAAYGGYLEACPSLDIKPLALSDVDKRALRTNYRHVAPFDCLAHLRDEVLSRASEWRGRCPMCACGRASTIDHYLPRSKFPEFAVFSPNLVPVCDQCNRLKADSVPDPDGTGFLHVYFDSLPETVYLEAVLDAPPLMVGYGLTFESDTPITRRIQHQFERLQLGGYYLVEATSELAAQADLLRDLPERGIEAAVRAHADRQRESSRSAFGTNHWRTALYKAIGDAKPAILRAVAGR